MTVLKLTSYHCMLHLSWLLSTEHLSVTSLPLLAKTSCSPSMLRVGTKIQRYKDLFFRPHLNRLIALKRCNGGKTVEKFATNKSFSLLTVSRFIWFICWSVGRSIKNSEHLFRRFLLNIQKKPGPPFKDWKIFSILSYRRKNGPEFFIANEVDLR